MHDDCNNEVPLYIKVRLHHAMPLRLRYNSERNRSRMGCKPIYLRAISLTQTQMHR